MMNIVPSTCMSCIMFPETFYVPNYVITNGSSLVIILDVSSWICAFFSYWTVINYIHSQKWTCISWNRNKVSNQCSDFHNRVQLLTQKLQCYLLLGWSYRYKIIWSSSRTVDRYQLSISQLAKIYLPFYVYFLLLLGSFLRCSFLVAF